MADVVVRNTVLAAPCRASAGSCRVIVPLTAPTAAELAVLAGQAAPAADLLEVRLDALAEYGLSLDYEVVEKKPDIS